MGYVKVTPKMVALGRLHVHVGSTGRPGDTVFTSHDGVSYAMYIDAISGPACQPITNPGRASAIKATCDQECEFLTFDTIAEGMDWIIDDILRRGVPLPEPEDHGTRH